MFNALSYHYKMSHEEIGRLTLHQFNSKVEFLNKMFSEKDDPKPRSVYNEKTSASNPENRKAFELAIGVK